MELKDRIRLLRKERNLKQNELGKAIGVNLLVCQNLRVV